MRISALLPLLGLASSITIFTPVLAQQHAGRMDTDGILSPGEIPNPRIDYGRYDNSGRRPDRGHDRDDCRGSGRYSAPRVEIYEVRRKGNVFSDKVKVRGAVEGVCIDEAGLFENGRLVDRIPTAVDPRFQRFEFEVTTRLDEYPEIRAYNTAGDRDIAPVR